MTRSFENLQNARRPAGLCRECRHRRTICSDHGSVFYMCGRAANDSRFPRYPRLPVLECTGFEMEPAAKEP